MFLQVFVAVRMLLLVPLLAFDAWSSCCYFLLMPVRKLLVPSVKDNDACTEFAIFRNDGYICCLWFLSSMFMDIQPIEQELWT